MAAGGYALALIKGNGNNGNGNNKNNSTDTTALSSILEGYSTETPTVALPQIQLPSREDLLTNAEARFYDAQTRTWLAMDPIKDGDNWYQYVYSNPIKYFDPNGLWVFAFGIDMTASFIGRMSAGYQLVNFITR